MKFDEVVGQRDVCRRLVSMERERHLPHALLLCGPRGCGKMAVALAFASYLLCKNKTADGDACGRCRQCVMLGKWHHPDLHFTYPVIRPAGTASDHRMTSDDFAGEWNDMLMQGPYFSIDTWLTYMKAANQQAVTGVGESDSLVHKLSFKSSQGGYKVSIIWLPERMNAECANKLLKIIEEPPSQTLFVMVSEEPQLLLETIRSRAQRIDMRRIDDDDIMRALVERRGLDDDTARRIARSSAGSWLGAMELLTADNENGLFLDMFKLLTRTAYRRDVKEMKSWSETVAGYGREKQKRMMTYFLRMIRENFMYNFRRPQLCYMTAEEEAFARNFSPFVNEGNVIPLAELFDHTIRDIGQNANAKIQFFDLALNVTVLLRAK